MLFSYLAHRHACKTKQQERQDRIAHLSPVFHEPLTRDDTHILDQPVSALVKRVQDGAVAPTDILVAYGKKALEAHEKTNCLTEIMIGAAETWARECNTQGPLAGIPVSLKDTVGVEGWDNCIGYSAWVGQPCARDSALVRLLRDAGAVPFVKTNIPITLLSFESTNAVFGRSTNPHNAKYSPGGSSGGEAALLAYGGSRIGIGTDVAGSVRVPAHYSGIFSVRASVGRFPRTGSGTMYSPMARTLEDLETFWRAVCVPIPWREPEIAQKKLKWGVMWDDGVVRPSPACARALQMVIDTLSKHGHNVVTFDPPSPYEGIRLASQLIFTDAGETATAPMRAFEWIDPGMREAMAMFRLPSLLRRLYTWYVRHIRRDAVYAGLLDGWRAKDPAECMRLAAAREGYKMRWLDALQAQDLDFVLSVPNALPAVPHGGMKTGWRACGYTFLFNLLDYSAGVLPVTRVDASMDRLSGFKPRNAIEAGAYTLYDAKDMHGLPVGVQIVGRRFEEEKVLAGMKIVQTAAEDGLA
ncbi:amidase signature domain-containing protein [Infundibulicybe gibba]|nr:amidase signature domain-containing protein [Infundibulicybe gibba]